MNDVNRIVSPTFHILVLWIILCFFTVIVLAFIFEVEIVARGEGKVVPQGRVQLVQTEFPGKINQINVDNGDLVKQGDVLIELNNTEIIAEITKIELEINQLEIELLRINTFLKSISLFLEYGLDYEIDKTPTFWVKESKRLSLVYRQQSQLFDAEIKELIDALMQFKQRVISNKKAETVLLAEIKRSELSLLNQSKRLLASSDLIGKGLVSRSDHLNVKELYDTLKVDEQIAYKKYQQIVGQEHEIIAEYNSYLSSRRSLMYQRSAEIGSSLALLKQNLKQSQYIEQNKRLTSPINGYVDQLSVFTIGGVTQAGVDLLKIVPSDQKVVIEALFKNVDIGFLKAGQQANIKLEAFPSERFGFVKGEVNYVSADALQGPDGEWGFLVRITLDSPFLATRTDQFLLKPGMTATIDIITGKRKIISYFFAPILKTLEYSMGER